MLMVFNPKYESQLFLHPTGQILCAAALGFQLVGMIWIHKIVNIKV
jgi:Flp pilus assembly protein TadB